LGAVGQTNADCNLHDFTIRRIRFLRALFRWSLHVAQHKFCAGDCLTQRFHDVRYFRGRSFPKEDGKFFPAEPEDTATVTDVRKMACNHFEDLIPDVMAIGIVKYFKMVCVAHRNRELAMQQSQGFVESTPAGQSRQFVGGDILLKRDPRK